MGSDTITYIDLFAGVGGLSLGFEKESFENLFSIDFDRDACKTYRRNFPNNALLEKDIKNLTEKEILDLAEGREVDAIIGGTPCQGFSMAGGIGRKFIRFSFDIVFNLFVLFFTIPMHYNGSTVWLVCHFVKAGSLELSFIH